LFIFTLTLHTHHIHSAVRHPDMSQQSAAAAAAAADEPSARALAEAAQLEEIARRAAETAATLHKGYVHGLDTNVRGHPVDPSLLDLLGKTRDEWQQELESCYASAVRITLARTIDFSSREELVWHGLSLEMLMANMLSQHFDRSDRSHYGLTFHTWVPKYLVREGSP